MIPADDRKAVLPRRSAQDFHELSARLGVGVLKHAPRLQTQPPFYFQGAFLKAVPAH